MSMSDSGSGGGVGRARSGKRWIIPGAAVLFGLAYLVAGGLGGDRTFAFVGLAVMLVTGAAFLLLGRVSETVAGLLDRRDERINQLDGEATAVAGITLMAAVLVAFVVEIARGQDGQPYATLGAISGVTYVVALVVLRFRR
ncbi:hypothetical protein [Streptomyces capparidis]